MMVTLGACASGREPIARNLPAAPGFAQPVSVAEPRKGESAIAVAARERAGRKRANGVIVNMKAWYGQVRTSYSAK